MKKQLPKIILYIAILFAVFILLYALTPLRPDNMTPQNGTIDLSVVDLSETLVQIEPLDWAYYPGILYTPEDFAMGHTKVPVYGDNTSTEEFGTYALTVQLPQGQLYAISGHSPNLSMRLFVNGQLLGEVGSPGSTRETTIPRTKTYEYIFSPEGDQTELIFQIANFHHREGGRNTAILLSQPQVLNRYRSLELIRSNVVLGCVLTVSLYFFGMFIFFPKRKHFLFLAIAAFSTAVRMPFVGEKHIMVIFPELDWFVSIKTEYLCLLVFVASLLLYFHSLYPGMIHKGFMRVVLAFSILFGFTVLFTDSAFFTRAQLYYAVVWVCASLVTLWGLFRKMRERDIHIFLILCGFCTFFLTALYDEIRYLFFAHIRLDNTLIIGMLICLYMNMIALTLEFSQKEKELSESRIAVMLSRLQPHFLFNVLVAISQLCDIDAREAKKTVLRFSSYLRSNLDSISSQNPIRFEKELEHVQTYLSLEKLRFDEKANFVYDIQCMSFVLPSLTLQPLVENAIRHGIMKKEEGGTVTISTCEEEKCYVISVVDDGVGFDPSKKPEDGRSHVGIENVRNRLHAISSGSLEIYSAIGHGTKAVIKIPKNAKIHENAGNA